MAQKKLSERQELKVRSDREMEIFKANDMIQKGRHELTLQEQRCVLYAISKIKPDDTVFQEYTFELSDFYRLCGLQRATGARGRTGRRCGTFDETPAKSRNERTPENAGKEPIMKQGQILLHSFLSGNCKI